MDDLEAALRNRPAMTQRRRHTSDSFQLAASERSPLLHQQHNGRPRRTSVIDSHSTEVSKSMRRASAALFDVRGRRGRNSILDVRRTMEMTVPAFEEEETQTAMDEEFGVQEPAVVCDGIRKRAFHVGQQIPAVLLVCLLNLLLAIPFGVSYFPVGWSADGDASGGEAEDSDGVSGAFPLPGKEALGIRMFLFATLVGQVAFTFASKFKNPISLQMVENVPFCHALALTVISQQGYGIEALSTLFFLFGSSSVVVGLLFYALGRLRLGRVVYYFPGHVLVGCIGGIGVFIFLTGVEVTVNAPLKLTIDGLRELLQNWNLLAVPLFFEILLRFLMYMTQDKSGSPRFPLLSPIFFIMITPLFYLGLWLFRGDEQEAQKAGYFFPPADGCDPSQSCESQYQSTWDSIFNEHLFDIWTAISFSTISWRAVTLAFPTVIALAAFSLLHVPINIPAFGVSTNVDTDMNAELMAHGFSNGFSGLFGGLQNYMCYSNSVMYAKSHGEGTVSSLAIAAITCILFVVGPHLATYIPRCMAGTLLLHLGVDLVLEGVYDSIGRFDVFEYAGIWVITISMSLYGMTAALIAGVIAALSTYAAQSAVHHDPIHNVMTASTLRSSDWNRSPRALAILEDGLIGRNKILLIQLKGHLFFGNVASLTESIKALLSEYEPWIIILDFTLVNGLDSSAAHAIGKLKRILLCSFGLPFAVFVTGSPDGFPCEYALGAELSQVPHIVVEATKVKAKGASSDEAPTKRGSVPFATYPEYMQANLNKRGFPRSRVCDDLDGALRFGEDILIARAEPTFLQKDKITFLPEGESFVDTDEEENLLLSTEIAQPLAKKYLARLCPSAANKDVDLLLTKFTREEYSMKDIVWYQSSESDCAKLLCAGTLLSHLEGTRTTELVRKGAMIGEVGLVHGMKRLSRVECVSQTAIVYSINRHDWERLGEQHPRAARIMEQIAIRYLVQRVQHVSNRIIETRCMPI